MTKVATIVNDALQILRVIDKNSAADAGDARDMVRGLNLLVRGWEVEGISLGWQDVADAGNELPAPPEAEEAITFNLAVRMRSKFGKTLDADVIAIASDTLAMLRAWVAANEYDRLSYPDLPYGTGQRYGNWREGFFR